MLTRRGLLAALVSAPAAALLAWKAKPAPTPAPVYAPGGWKVVEDLLHCRTRVWVAGADGVLVEVAEKDAEATAHRLIDEAIARSEAQR